MKKTLFSLFVPALFAGAFSFAGAANLFNIIFPIAELGNCASQTECKTYCDAAANQDACVAFAEAHGFVSKEQVQKEKEISRLVLQGGPGGCVGRDACRAYCADSAHQNECAVFAKTHGLIKEKKTEGLDDLIAQGGPGGCKSEKECKIFCTDPANQDVCLQFAVDNNLISKEKIAKIQKFKDVAAQGGPGGCVGRDACRAYCADSAHQDECIAFAKERGLIDKEEVKMMERGRELARKIEEAGGPGDCTSERECRAYCEMPENVDACLAFAVEHGGFKQEEVRHMMKEFIKESVRQDGTSTEDDMMQAEEEHMKKFEHFRDIEEKFRKPEFLRQGQTTGPGGCTTPQECMKYCSDLSHRDECAQFKQNAEGLPVDVLMRKSEDRDARGIRGIKPLGTSSAPFEGNPAPFRMMPSQIKGEKSGGELKLEACTQEFEPVCGSDGRTYPNECFAKNNNVIIVKDGVCNSTDNPPSGMIPLKNDVINDIRPFLMPQKEIKPPPQSRNISDISFGMVLDAFRNMIPR